MTDAGVYGLRRHKKTSNTPSIMTNFFVTLPICYEEPYH